VTREPTTSGDRAATSDTGDVHGSLAAALHRQFAAMVRSSLRPASYLGLMRELLLTSVHTATYPLGLLPPTPFSHDVAHPSLPRRPVILVHGWVHNRSAFVLMQRALRRAGLGPLHTFEYPSITSDLNRVARDLARVVDQAVGQSREHTCVLIGHSMGGLVARQYVQELGGHELVDTVVTMGTPHRGTYTAWFGFGQALEQCRPGSAYLQQLEQSARPGLARWIAYYSDLDLMVAPAISAKLIHPALAATNVRIRDIGHLSLLLSRSVLGDLIARLEHFAAA
jgi:pimeloyl-ACP methyl ester carboxylesterase